MSSPSNNIQNIKCGWTGCAHRFGSEIDMNMHVMMNHMIILDHGEFMLNRRAPNRKRSAKEQEPQFQVEEPIQTPKRAPEPAQPHKFPVNMLPPPKPIKTSPNASLTIRHPLPKQLLSVQNDQNPDFEQVFGILAGNSNIFDALKQDIEATTANLTGVAGMVEGPSQSSSQRTNSPPDSKMNILAQKKSLETKPLANMDLGDEVEVQIQQNLLNLDQLLPPRKMSDVVDEFLERLRPMKQLGFIRPNRSVYCIVCLKYVRSFHECNWRHTLAEDRVAEMWYRRFGPEKPTGKNQLMRELEEIKTWLQTEEEDGIAQET